ncbi:hypothetical protein COB57_04130 [Candidatus Peregrinibacteria bacterium]|nr:MAG: hypothetical protein COB57_04130 [Candidatus Peregrinibacteria bacterium]
MQLHGYLAFPTSSELIKNVHEAGYKAHHLHAQYKLFPVPEEQLEAFFDIKVKKEKICLSVGDPYKEKVQNLCHEISIIAQSIGAINTIYFREGKLIGHNTEFLGIKKAIQKEIDLEDKNIVIIGANSLARAAIYAGLMSGGNVTILDSDIEKSKKLSKIFSCDFGTFEDYKRSFFDVVIHTATVDTGEDSFFEEKHFHKNQVVLDCNFHEKETDFIKIAEAAGATIVLGEDFFLVQAYEQFNFFTGKDAPREVMKKEYEENVV